MTKAERQARYRERLRVRLASPSAVALAASDTPDAQLDGFTRAVRDRLDRYIADAGGAHALAATKMAQIRSLVESELVLEALSRDVVALARAGQLWSLRTRRAAVLLHDWLKLKSHRDALLIAVGLTRTAAPRLDLAEEARLAILEEQAKDRARAEAASEPRPQPELDPPGRDRAGQVESSPPDPVGDF